MTKVLILKIKTTAGCGSYMFLGKERHRNSGSSIRCNYLTGNYWVIIPIQAEYLIPFEVCHV